MNKIFSIITSSLLFLSSYAQQMPDNRLVSPEVERDAVTFRLNAPQAEEVILYGDFIPGVDMWGLGGSVKMTKNDEGIWKYMACNLASEFYFYYYEVDGVKILDPLNLKVAHNFREYLSTFIIQGEKSKYYEVADKHKGTLSQVWYPSKMAGVERRMNVYLPYGYSEEKEYPVLYLQHGGGDDEENWVDMGRVCQIMDHLIDEGKAEPMVIVMPNSWAGLQASFNIIIPEDMSVASPMITSESKYIEDLVYSIIPYTESHFSVKTGKGNRAISGLSLGGSFTMTIIKQHPELFDYIAVMGCGLGSPGNIDNVNDEEALGPLKRSGYNLFWLGAGTKDMGYVNAMRLIEGFKKMGMDYVYYNSLDGHNWRSWRKNIIDFVPLLFK